LEPQNKGRGLIYPKDLKSAKIFAYLLQTFHQLSGINIIVIYSAHLAKQSIPHLT